MTCNFNIDNATIDCCSDECCTTEFLINEFNTVRIKKCAVITYEPVDGTANWDIVFQMAYGIPAVWTFPDVASRDAALIALDAEMNVKPIP